MTADHSVFETEIERDSFAEKKKSQAIRRLPRHPRLQCVDHLKPFGSSLIGPSLSTPPS